MHIESSNACQFGIVMITAYHVQTWRHFSAQNKRSKTPKSSSKLIWITGNRNIAIKTSYSSIIHLVFFFCDRLQTNRNKEELVNPYQLNSDSIFCTHGPFSDSRNTISALFIFSTPKSTHFSPSSCSYQSSYIPLRSATLVFTYALRTRVLCYLVLFHHTHIFCFQLADG